VSGPLASFLADARSTLDIAIYDLRLEPATAQEILAAVAAARARGVRIRVVFNVDQRFRTGDPPPPSVDWELVKQLGEFQPISGVPDLMHHKYVARDAGTPAAAVWTGSANWTNDSWTREENLLVRLRSPALAEVYEQNFEELWTKRDVAVSGHEQPAWVELASDLSARAYFTPGRAEKLVHEIAQAAATARWYIPRTPQFDVMPDTPR